MINRRNKILVLVIFIVVICIGIVAVIQSDLFYDGQIITISSTTLKVPDNFSVKSGSSSMGATLKNSNGTIWIKKGVIINRTYDEQLNYNWIDIHKYNKVPFFEGIIKNGNLTGKLINTTAYSFTKDGVSINIFVESGINNPDEIIRFITS